MIFPENNKKCDRYKNERKEAEKGGKNSINCCLCRVVFGDGELDRSNLKTRRQTVNHLIKDGEESGVGVISI